MAFGLVPKILNAVDVVVAVRKELGMVDSEMMKVRHIQHVIAAPAVRIDDAVGDDFALDDWHERCRGGVGNYFGKDLSTPV